MGIDIAFSGQLALAVFLAARRAPSMSKDHCICASTKVMSVDTALRQHVEAVYNNASTTCTALLPESPAADLSAKACYRLALLLPALLNVPDALPYGSRTLLDFFPRQPAACKQQQLHHLPM